MPTLKADAVLKDAQDLAREALAEVAEPGALGEHLGFEMVDERLGTHYFACETPAYRGWRWAASLARVPRGKVATVCETNLVPGEDSILAPEWLPYADRLAPGDLGPGDVTAFVEDDPLLVAGYEATGDEDEDHVALWELGLGRERVLSPEGRERAAQRWYDGDNGPNAPVALKATAPCSSCGFFVPLAGALRPMFGVCANEWSPSDGGVVSIDHGCGAHSQVDVVTVPQEVVPPPLVDDLAVDAL